MNYYTELFKNEDDARKPDECFVLITDKPFAEFKAEVYGTHMALHKCQILDIDGNWTELNESIPPFDYIHWNAKIINWRPRRDLSREDLQIVFEQICENNLDRIRQSKAILNL